MSPASQPFEPLTPDSLVVEAEERIDWTALKRFYRERGIKCLNCPAAEIENFRDGAKLHGFDLDAHIQALNALALSDPFRAYPPGPVRRFVRWLTGGGKTPE